ncbi:hypothetical protein APA_2684 [Pseudanabaena sp. lw0831]|nr:hypothetical protein APA_2684 [Pseudanabaena sp. lw0831]
MKKQFLHTRYYSDFLLFSSAISDCLAQPQIQFKLEIASLHTCTAIPDQTNHNNFFKSVALQHF